jgi:hypothetical protein
MYTFCSNAPYAHALVRLRRLKLAHGRRQAARDPDAPPATHDLVAAVQLRLDVYVPPPLDAVPGPLLGSAGGLVLKLLLQVRPVVVLRSAVLNAGKLCMAHVPCSARRHPWSLFHWFRALCSL